MQTVLILGAGLSSTSLIKYFLDHSHHQWKIRVGDIKLENAIERISEDKGCERSNKINTDLIGAIPLSDAIAT